MTGAATALPSGLLWEQFVELLEHDEYKNAELIDGQVVVNTPTWAHQRICTKLIIAIGNWAQAGEDRGEVTFNPRVRVSRDTGYLPDVAWYRDEQADAPPDLAVEVLSPSTRTLDRVRKRADYARVGVGELWLIDPDGPAAVILRRPTGAGFVVVADLDADGELTSPQLPGLIVRVGDLVIR